MIGNVLRSYSIKLSLVYIDNTGNILTSDNTTSKIKLFWHYIKGQWQDKTGISILKLPHCEVTDPTEKAEKINEHFKSVFTVEDLKDIPALNESINLCYYA